MTTQWIIGIVVAFVLLSVGFYLFSCIYAAHCIYIATLKRRNKEQWGRTLSIPTDLSVRMDEIGMEWQRRHDAYKHDVQIVNADGMHLYGEYYDFGADKAVIVLSGRTESLRYGYFFAAPYSESGLNVLVIDSRAHGLSDGEYNTVGFEESKDAVAWARFLQEERGVQAVVFHGICIGAAAGMLGITSADCPSCVKGLVTEGMFANFGESMKNHLIERKRLWFPVMQCIDFWMKHYTGHSMTVGPINAIPAMRKPLLMIQSKMDKYSTPANAQIMYDLCPSDNKQLVWYETGDHSMLRITDTAYYDDAVKQFLSRLFSTAS